MAFTAAELIDLRRFAGFPALGGGAAVSPEAVAFEAALAALTADEQTLVRETYLVRLRAVEATIASLMETADTKRAAVWERNPDAMRDAAAAMAYWRSGLVDLLGLPLGPFGYSAAAAIPALFAV